MPLLLRASEIRTPVAVFGGWGLIVHEGLVGVDDGRFHPRVIPLVWNQFNIEF